MVKYVYITIINEYSIMLFISSPTSWAKPLAPGVHWSLFLGAAVSLGKYDASFAQWDTQLTQDLESKSTRVKTYKLTWIVKPVFRLPGECAVSQ